MARRGLISEWPCWGPWTILRCQWHESINSPFLIWPVWIGFPSLEAEGILTDQSHRRLTRLSYSRTLLLGCLVQHSSRLACKVHTGLLFLAKLFSLSIWLPLDTPVSVCLDPPGPGSMISSNPCTISLCIFQGCFQNSTDFFLPPPIGTFIPVPTHQAPDDRLMEMLMPQLNYKFLKDHELYNECSQTFWNLPYSLW